MVKESNNHPPLSDSSTPKEISHDQPIMLHELIGEDRVAQLIAERKARKRRIAARARLGPAALFGGRRDI